MKRIKETNRLLAENLVRSIMKDYEACGIAAAIIDKNGVTQYEKFWGVRDLESRKELDGETIFGLASVTKSFTALAIMQMEERGILKLDDPVSRYVPEFTNKNQKTVTIRHLLTHSGGFFLFPGSWWIRWLRRWGWMRRRWEIWPTMTLWRMKGSAGWQNGWMPRQKKAA